MPPQNYDEIVELMSNLEKFINDNSVSDWDPLVKMAVIHHQFESIHPFYDGNGRTGRIINKQKFGRDNYYINFDLYDHLGSVNSFSRV